MAPRDLHGTGAILVLCCCANSSHCPERLAQGGEQGINTPVATLPIQGLSAQGFLAEQVFTLFTGGSWEHSSSAFLFDL